jgi:hypothetical protein
VGGAAAAAASAARGLSQTDRSPTAGILVFQQCLGPAVFAAIAELLSDGPSDGLV